MSVVAAWLQIGKQKAAVGGNADISLTLLGCLLSADTVEKLQNRGV
jgi:hypothetical protein